MALPPKSSGLVTCVTGCCGISSGEPSVVATTVPSATARTSAPKPYQSSGRAPSPANGWPSCSRAKSMEKISCLPIRAPPTGTRTARWTDAAAQQPLLANQPSPRSGGAMIVVGRGSTGSCGPSITKLPIRDRTGASGATSYVMWWSRRSTARSGGTVTSMTTATVPEAGIAAVGVRPRSGCVAVTRSSPSSCSSVAPSGVVTVIAVRVTGAMNPLVTSRSYSRWSTPSLPDTRKGSFVDETTMAVVLKPAAGEETGVASWACPLPGSVAMAPPSKLAATKKRSRGIIEFTPRRENGRTASATARVRWLVRTRPSRSGYGATGTQVVPGVRVAHALKHLLNRFDHQLRLILVDVVAALAGHGEASVRDQRGQILVLRLHERFQFFSREPLRVIRQVGRPAVGEDGQGHRRQRCSCRRLAHHRVACAEADRLEITVAGNRDDLVPAKLLVEPHQRLPALGRHHRLHHLRIGIDQDQADDLVRIGSRIQPREESAQRVAGQDVGTGDLCRLQQRVQFGHHLRGSARLGYGVAAADEVVFADAGDGSGTVVCTDAGGLRHPR